MQEPEIIFDDAYKQTHADEQVAHDAFKQAYGSVSDEQAAEALSADDSLEFPQSQATYEAIAKFNFVQQLTAKRTMRDNSRRTKILAGNEKVASLVARFKA